MGNVGFSYLRLDIRSLLHGLCERCVAHEGEIVNAVEEAVDAETEHGEWLEFLTLCVMWYLCFPVPCVCSVSSMFFMFLRSKFTMFPHRGILDSCGTSDEM